MRKLVIFVCAFSISILLSIYLFSPYTTVICAGVCTVLSFLFIVFRGKTRTRFFIFCLGLAFGFIYFFAHAWFFTYPAESYYGATEYIGAEVTSFPSDNYVTVKLDNGDIRASLCCYNGFPENVSPGDRIYCEVDFADPDTDYLYTSGVKLYAYTTEVTVIDKDPDIRHFGALCANYTKSLIKSIFPEDTFAFAKALLTGDKSDFYKDEALTLSFENAGLSHIVAVSGMHLSFVLALPSVFIKNRRRFSFFSIPFIFFFMSFAGFTPSVCRAGIMHLCISAANLSKRESDDLTSLFTAVFIILLSDPYAAASISLQLSFASVLGIILFSDRIFKALSKPAARYGKILSVVYRGIISILSASVGALIFTVPLCAVYFGKVSVIAPVVSVFVLSILSLTFCLCIISCLFGIFSLPLGITAAKITSYLLRYIMSVAKAASETGMAAVYMSNKAMLLWLILTYFVLIFICLLKRPAKAYIIPVCVSFICLCAITTLPRLFPKSDDFEMTVLDAGQGQSIVVTSENMTAVIDCGSSYGTDAGEITSAFLHSKNIDTVDILILTHYHADHANGASRIITEFGVKALFLPVQDEESEYADEIISAAESLGSEIFFIESDTSVQAGSVVLNVYQPVFPGGENERCAAVLCTYNDYDVLITGDMPAYCELLLLEHTSLPDIEVLIAGHHGAETSSCVTLLNAVKPETAVISVGENSYGHPSEETLRRFEEYGIQVLRTDLIGSITLN